MHNEYLKLQLLHELREAVQVKNINVELLETLQSSLVWLVRYCETNNIELKDRDRILSLLEKSHHLIKEIYPNLPTNLQQPIMQHRTLSYSPTSENRLPTVRSIM